MVARAITTSRDFRLIHELLDCGPDCSAVCEWEKAVSAARKNPRSMASNLARHRHSPSLQQILRHVLVVLVLEHPISERRGSLVLVRTKSQRLHHGLK